MTSLEYCKEHGLTLIALTPQKLPGRVHLSVDGWTSLNIFSFLGITMHWIQDGELQHLILDFIK